MSTTNGAQNITISIPTNGGMATLANGAPLSPGEQSGVADALFHLAEEAERRGEIGMANELLMKAVQLNGGSGLNGYGGESSPLLRPAGGIFGGMPGVVMESQLAKSLLRDADGGTLARGGPSQPQGTPYRVSPTLLHLGGYTGILDPAAATGRTFDFLEATARLAPIQAIHGTWVTKVLKYANHSESRKVAGWQVRMRDENAPLTRATRKRIKELEDLIQYGGFYHLPGGETAANSVRHGDAHGPSKRRLRTNRLTGEPGVWDGRGEERASSFAEYLSITTRQLLTYDWVPVRTEPGANPRKYPVAFASTTDAKRIRRVVQFGERRYRPQIDPSLQHVAFVELEPGFDHMTLREFGWDRMDVMVLNPQTDFFRRGYGVSPVELGLEIASALLSGMTFQKEYFDSNHIPVGILKIVGQMADMNTRQHQYLQSQLMQIGGIGAFFKMLVLPMAPSGPGQTPSDISFLPLRAQTGTLQEMQFIEQFFNMLYNLMCALHWINSEEVGWSSVSVNGPALSQGSQEFKIEHSQEKGFKPVMALHQAFLDRQRIERTDPDFMFCFTGLEQEDPAVEEQIRTARMTRGLTLNQIRDENDEPRLKAPALPDLWDTVSQKFAPESFDTAEDWRRKVNEKYVKEFKKLADSPAISPWLSYPDLPIMCAAAMQSAMQEQAALTQALMPQPQPGADPNADPNAQQPGADPNDPWGHGDDGQGGPPDGDGGPEGQQADPEQQAQLQVQQQAQAQAQMQDQVQQQAQAQAQMQDQVRQQAQGGFGQSDDEDNEPPRGRQSPALRKALRLSRPNRVDGAVRFFVRKSR